MEKTVEWTLGQFFFWVLVLAVVLTGVTTPELLAASDIRPDYVLQRLDELLPS